MKAAYDVIVVGAGPAGSTAARILATNGVDVLLIEREREIGANVLCAEGISRSSLEKFVGGESRYVASKIMRGLLSSPSAKVEASIPNSAYILDRKLFDRYLAEEAAREGANIQVGTTLKDIELKKGEATVTLDGRFGESKVRAKVVIGADGASSTTGRKAGMKVDILKEYSHYCAQYFIYDPTIEDDRIEFHVGRDIAPGGYAWVFPKGRGLANVGVGVDFDSRPAINYLNRFVNARFRSPKILGFLKGIVPIGGRKTEMVKDNVVLVGDAARLADPLSGGGIALAMQSATVASSVILEALRDGDVSRESLGRYEEEYWKIEGSYYELSFRLLQLWRRLSDEEINTIVEDLGTLFGGRELKSLNPFQILKSLISVRRSLGIITKRGGDVLWSYLRETVFKRG